MLYLPQACLPEKVGGIVPTQCFTELFFNTLLSSPMKMIPRAVFGPEAASAGCGDRRVARL